MNKPDILDYFDERNKYQIILYKNGEPQPQTVLYYTTFEKAQEIADFLNSTLVNSYAFKQKYVVEKKKYYVRN